MPSHVPCNQRADCLQFYINYNEELGEKQWENHVTIGCVWFFYTVSVFVFQQVPCDWWHLGMNHILVLLSYDQLTVWKSRPDIGSDYIDFVIKNL